MGSNRLLLLPSFMGEHPLSRKPQLSLGKDILVTLDSRCGTSSQGGTSCDRMQLASIGSPKLFSHRLYADCDDVFDTAPSLRELRTPSLGNLCPWVIAQG